MDPADDEPRVNPGLEIEQIAAGNDIVRQHAIEGLSSKGPPGIRANAQGRCSQAKLEAQSPRQMVPVRLRTLTELPRSGRCCDGYGAAQAQSAPHLLPHLA